MANVVNRNLDGPPTQGRSRECRRRLRQLARRDAPPPLAIHVTREMRDLVEAIQALPPEVQDGLMVLDDAELAYVENQVDVAQALVETAPAGVEPMEYARRVLAAMGGPVTLNYKPAR